MRHSVLRIVALGAVAVLAAITVIGLPEWASPAKHAAIPPAGIAAVVDEWARLSGADAAVEHNSILEVWTVLSDGFVEKSALDAGAMSLAAIEAMKDAAGNVAQPAPDQLSLVAIEAMLDVLDDPYTTFMSAQEYELYTENSQGKFGGIGATVGLRNERITVTAPIPDTPAERAGILPGDVILAVDGESTEGWSVLESVLRIRGPEGTPVRLLVQHEHETEPVEIEIVRAVIQVASVEWQMLPEGIAHVEISSFSDNTDEQMSDIIDEAKQANAKAMILDLRGNPGGLLSTTVNIASEFLQDGLVLYSLDGDGNRVEYKVNPDGSAPDLPLAVLVDGNSASGSEVLAGALRDHDRAVLIGEDTFGKGSVNLPQGLADGSGLYYTIGRWYSPDGHLIEGEGLAPDIEVVQPSDIEIELGMVEDRDLPLERAVEHLLSQAGAAAP